MKKSIWVFSLAMLLFSTFAPSFTYATGEVADEPSIDETNSDLENQLSNLSWDESNSWDVDLMNSSTWIVLPDLDSSDDLFDSNSSDNDIQEFLSQSYDDLKLNADDWKDCYDYEYDNVWTLSIENYHCSDTNIIVPTSEYWDDKTTAVLGWTFSWKLIESLEMPRKFSVYSEAFSWAIFSWDITLEEKESWQYFNELYSIIVAEWATLTIKQPNRLYRWIINWKLIYDLNGESSIDYILNQWTINWEVEIIWLNWTVNNSFNNAYFWDSSNIILSEWITQISNSFWYREGVWTIIKWNINLPNSLFAILNSFNYSLIETNLSFSNSLSLIDASFGNSSIDSDILITWDNRWVKFYNSSFSYSNITWNFILSWLDIDIFNLNPQSIFWDVKVINSHITWSQYFLTLKDSKIVWNVEFINTNIENLEGNLLHTTISWDLIVEWNINIPNPGRVCPNVLWSINFSWNNINLPICGGRIIGKDVIITGNDINMNYWFSWTNVWWDVQIIWNNITSQFSSWTNSHIDWNFSMSWWNIVLWYSFLNKYGWTPYIWKNFILSWNTITVENTAIYGIEILWDFIIKADSLQGQYSILEWLDVSWIFQIPDDPDFWPDVLNWTISRKISVLDNPRSTTLLYNILWDLRINNSDNAPIEEFSWKSVWWNIFLDWEISRVWASAYAFSSWNIQPITLSSNFNTWDIGENAFCVNWNPVIAYTMKVVSQTDRNYLLQHSCLDIKSAFNISFNVDWNVEIVQYNWRNIDDIPNPSKPWYEFIWWFEKNSEAPFDFANTTITEDKTFYAHWKALEEKAQETTSESVVYTNETTVTIWDDIQEESINNSSLINLVSKEVETEEVKTEEEKITVQESEIKVTSDKTVEYQGWLEVYLEKTENVGTENETTERIEWTAKFSSPVAVKIPIYSNAETVKVQVKHEWEEFGYKGLTINPINSCSNGEAVNDKYNGENISLKDVNWEKYVLIYTCSASTFVAYTENTKPINNITSISSPAAWGGRTIKQESKTVEQEHNSADTNKIEVEDEESTQTTKATDTTTIQEKAKIIQWRSLTRWEVAVMTNILLDVYPQLTEKRELNEVSEACENYADEQNFTKDEKKAITRLCKLSIMWIHNDNEKPLDEFMVNEITKNDEFSKVINRSLSTYTEKDFSVVKEALKKLENNEENVVFGTVYDVFMSIKNIFG